VTAATGRIFFEALILHSGTRMATAEAKVRDEAGKLYAHASTTCLVFPLPLPPSS
jgi:acyl-coenzyme A thioesterase PaaI-like protein